MEPITIERGAMEQRLGGLKEDLSKLIAQINMVTGQIQILESLLLIPEPKQE